MDIPRGRRLRSLLGLLLLVFPGACPGRAAWLRRVGFELKASVRSVTIDADIRAGGELLVQAAVAGDGAVAHVLERPLVHPWKFYWVDPAGPWGEKVWGGTMTTLPAYAPGVQEATDAEALGFIREVWKQWKQEGGDHRLNGNDSFYVFLPPQGRLGFTITRDGRQTGDIPNQLTRTWIRDGVARWKTGQVGAGYSFGEEFDAPPASYEPHTYHALVDALRLLSVSLMKGDSPEATAGLGVGGSYPIGLGKTPRRAFQVLKTLIPMIGETVNPGEDAVMPHRVEALDEVRMTLVGDTGAADLDFGDGIRGRVTRRSVFDRSSGTVRRDQLEVHFRQDGSTRTRLELRIGYGPVSAP